MGKKNIFYGLNGGIPSADALYDIRVETSFYLCYRRAMHNTTNCQSIKNIYFIYEHVKEQNVFKNK